MACRLTIVGYILHDHNVCAEDGEHSQSTGNVCMCMCKGIKRAKMCVRKTTRRVKREGGDVHGKNARLYYYYYYYNIRNVQEHV